MASHPGINSIEAYVDECWHNITDKQKQFIVDIYNGNPELQEYIVNKMEDYDEDYSWRDYRNSIAESVESLFPKEHQLIEQYIKTGNVNMKIEEVLDTLEEEMDWSSKQVTLESIGIGDKVVYIPDHLLKEDIDKMIEIDNLGVVTSKNDTYIFVRYKGRTAGIATRPVNLYTIKHKPELAKLV